MQFYEFPSGRQVRHFCFLISVMYLEQKMGNVAFSPGNIIPRVTDYKYPTSGLTSRY